MEASTNSQRERRCDLEGRSAEGLPADRSPVGCTPVDDEPVGDMPKDDPAPGHPSGVDRPVDGSPAGYPRSGGVVTRAIGSAVLRLAGWRIDGALPELPKFVVCVVPHTSNWDFVIGYAAKMAFGLRAGWLGKHTLFRGLMGPLLRAMGGIPVDRDAAHGVVGAAVAGFRSSERLVLGVAPEGTRRRVDRWKSGYYHIARQSGVPIVPVALDWGARRVRIGATLDPSGDEASDVETLLSFFRSVRGRVPERAFPPPADAPLSGPVE